MKIGILGTGMVGEAIGTKLAQLGHEVRMGSRSAGNERALAWAQRAGPRASTGTFAETVAFGPMVFLCLKGDAELDVVRSVGPAAFAGRIVVDVSNPLDFSADGPPTLLFCNTTSLGEQVQAALPDARVVKTLNIVTADVMVDPGRTDGTPTMLLCGEDRAAKADVTTLLRSLGWQDVIDLGGIIHSRGQEMLLPVWLSLWGALGSPYFGFAVVRPPQPAGS